MKDIANKLKSQAGETLVETLVSIIIAVISVTLLLMAAATAASVGAISKTSDQAFEDALSLAESRTGTAATTGSITIQETTTNLPAEGTGTPYHSQVKVNLYGGEDLYSYNISNAPDTPAPTGADAEMISVTTSGDGAGAGGEAGADGAGAGGAAAAGAGAGTPGTPGATSAGAPTQ